MMKPAPSMEKAVNHEPKMGREAPAGGGKSPVGPEKKAAMKSAGVGGSGIGGAVAELNKQHPIKYHDHGPHHGDSSHIRHEPGKY